MIEGQPRGSDAGASGPDVLLCAHGALRRLMEVPTLPGPRRIRCLAYLRARRGPEAVQEIQSTLELRSLDPTNPVFSVLRLELARAYALSGDTAKNRQSYQDFLALWSDADPDLPLLQKARDEYARLR